MTIIQRMEEAVKKVVATFTSHELQDPTVLRAIEEQVCDEVGPAIHHFHIEEVRLV